MPCIGITAYQGLRMTMNEGLKHKRAVAAELERLYRDARSGSIAAKDAERLSRILRRLGKIVPDDAANAAFLSELEQIA